MQKQDDKSVQGAGVNWVLSLGAVRVHNDHLQGGQRSSAGCGVCQEGLGGALAPLANRKEPVEDEKVVESGGADKEADAAPSHDPWPDWR